MDDDAGDRSQPRADRAVRFDGDLTRSPGDVPVGTVVSTTVPPRLDRLPWSSWHRRVIVALGITWTLDGLEATLISAAGPVLTKPDTLGLTEGQLGIANGCYLAGEVAGALVFGHLTDRYGRKRLFLVTIVLYLVATALTGASQNLAFFAVCRLFAGAGIGGEYAAINSAIDELVPARVRGHVDLVINGTYWLGVAMGAALTVVLLNEALIPHAIGWRLIFALGAMLGVAITRVRRDVAESPRWLVMHGRLAEADEVVTTIESAARGPDAPHEPDPPPVRVRVSGSVGFGYVAHMVFTRHRRRALLGLVLMVAQAFFYNSIFFTYGLVLHRFYGVPPHRIGLYLIPFAVGNFLGPALLGRLFDTVGRRVMISTTYVLSGILLILTGWAFVQGWLTATTQTLAWCAVFFVASSAASSAYLTVSELFPVEIRGIAIALFFSVAAGASIVAPVAFGAIIESGSRPALFAGTNVAAAMMIAAGLTAAVLAEDAEQKSLEHLAGDPGAPHPAP
jgi:MFS family permease